MIVGKVIWKDSKGNKLYVADIEKGHCYGDERCLILSHTTGVYFVHKEFDSSNLYFCSFMNDEDEPIEHVQQFDEIDLNVTDTVPKATFRKDVPMLKAAWKYLRGGE